jgi:Uma2 family endonuclease
MRAAKARAAVATVEQLLSAEEFERLPSPKEGGKIELVDGRVVTTAPIGGEHGNIASGPVLSLGAFMQAHGL